MDSPHKLRVIEGGRGDGPRSPLHAPLDTRPLWRRCVTPAGIAATWLAVMVPWVYGYGGYVLLVALCLWAGFASYDLTHRLIARWKRPRPSASAP